MIIYSCISSSLLDKDRFIQILELVSFFLASEKAKQKTKNPSKDAPQNKQKTLLHSKC